MLALKYNIKQLWQYNRELAFLNHPLDDLLVGKLVVNFL